MANFKVGQRVKAIPFELPADYQPDTNHPVSSVDDRVQEREGRSTARAVRSLRMAAWARRGRGAIRAGHPGDHQMNESRASGERHLGEKP